MTLNNKHGGARKGSGRKKLTDPTEQIRVPSSLAIFITQLKDLYKGLSHEDQIEVRDQIRNLIHFAKLNQMEK
ncbi:hypothetical protein MW369_004768 [Vibrio parahaemolyticus]|nr:hypothetical protein [Vibrio parahaemolyticus]